MLLEQIQADLKQAMLAKDEAQVSTLRLLLSEVKNASIAKGVDLSDPDIISIIQKEAKKRNESVASFKSGGREDLANKELTELNILQTYLPAQLTDEEITKIVEDTITELGTTSISDMGKVMGAVVPKIAGRADGGKVSGIVKQKLGS